MAETGKAARSMHMSFTQGPFPGGTGLRKVGGGISRKDDERNRIAPFRCHRIQSKGCYDTCAEDGFVRFGGQGEIHCSLLDRMI